MNMSCGELGGFMVGGAGWRHTCRELSDPSVESYDLRLSEQPAILFSHDYREITMHRVIPRALCPICNWFF